MEILLSLFSPTEWAWDHTCSPDIAKRPNDISLHQNKGKTGIWAPDPRLIQERDSANTLVESLIQQGTPLPEGGIEVGITVPVVYLSHGKGEEFSF